LHLKGWFSLRRHALIGVLMQQSLNQLIFILSGISEDCP
jgi:hypothetical protein